MYEMRIAEVGLDLRFGRVATFLVSVIGQLLIIPELIDHRFAHLEPLGCFHGTIYDPLGATDGFSEPGQLALYAIEPRKLLADTAQLPYDDGQGFRRGKLAEVG